MATPLLWLEALAVRNPVEGERDSGMIPNGIPG